MTTLVVELDGSAALLAEWHAYLKNERPPCVGEKYRDTITNIQRDAADAEPEKTQS
jgi:hypothetical protein